MYSASFKFGGSDVMFSQGCGDRRWITLAQTDYVHYRAKLLSQGNSAIRLRAPPR